MHIYLYAHCVCVYNINVDSPFKALLLPFTLCHDKLFYFIFINLSFKKEWRQRSKKKPTRFRNEQVKWNKLSGDREKKKRTTPRIRKRTVEKNRKIFIKWNFCFLSILRFFAPINECMREKKKSATEIKNLNLNAKNEEKQKKKKQKKEKQKRKSKKKKKNYDRRRKSAHRKKNRRRNSTNTLTSHTKRANKVYKKKFIIRFSEHE